LSAALNLSVCFGRGKKKRNEETKRQKHLSLRAFPSFQLLRSRLDLSIAPTKTRARCSQGCKLHKMHQKKNELWKVLSVLYLMGFQRPSSPSAAFRHVWKLPLLTTAVQTGSKEQLRCCEFTPQPLCTDKPPLLCRALQAETFQFWPSHFQPERTRANIIIWKSTESPGRDLGHKVLILLCWLV